ncbi:MFS transporter [Burkholderia aenigmatica]|nr:MFS transporter [Burkholderia aenigmatica]
MIGGTAVNYIALYYLASYAVQVLHFPMALSLWAPVAGSALIVVCAPLAGMLSDRVGRKLVLVISRLLLIVSIYPAFMLIHAVATLTVLVSVCTVLAILSTFTIVPGLVLQPELFPSHVRVTGMSIVYCAGASIFGGYAQFSATLLIKLSGNVFSPAWYLIACGLISLTPLPFMRETAGLDRLIPASVFRPCDRAWPAPCHPGWLSRAECRQAARAAGPLQRSANNVLSFARSPLSHAIMSICRLLTLHSKSTVYRRAER